MPYIDPVHGKTTEHDEQVAVFQWSKDMERFVPELALLYAVPNEYMMGWRKTRRGKRYNPTLTRMKKEGLRGGVPDIFLPVARNNYHGFYIEMKIGKNIPSDKQKQWLVALTEQGYRVDIHYSADDAIRALCDYLNVNDRFL